MCGIVAFYGNNSEVYNTLLTGLKRLEYRGYDSSGIAVIESASNFYSKKTVGRVLELEKELIKDSKLVSGFGDNSTISVGIAHTRWATHGIPSELNAHPHFSTDKKISIVHNGIIENYKDLKSELESKGVVFVSQTDTEVIAHLIRENYKGDLRNAVLDTLKSLKGAFAIAVISSDEPGRLIGAKKGSPMVLGVGNGEYILASDVSAVISKTREVIYLEDNEFIELNKNGYTISTFENENLEKEIQTIDWDEEAASKDGFTSFMEKEIYEQIRVIEDSYRGRLILDDGLVKFGGLIDVKDKLNDVDKVVITGIGGSFYAAQLGELYFEDIAKITAKSEMSPELRYKNSVLDEKTWVIALSQSGETADTIAAIEEAKRKNSMVTGIVNVVGSTISRLTEAGVYNHIGPETAVASTKATTSQYLILLMHAILLGRMRGLGYNQSKEIIEDILKLPEYFSKVIETKLEIEQIVKKYLWAKNFAFLGRGFNYPIAREGAIKLKEISYVHAEAFSGGELKHGPLAMINPEFPSFVICPDDSVLEKQLSNIEEIKARGGKVIALTTENNYTLGKSLEDVIYVPKTKTDYLQPIVNNIAQQLFAYYFALNLGLDVDKPRNLAKSVTVE